MSEPVKQEVQLSPKAKMLNEVNLKLEMLLKEQAEAMPKNFNETRFLQNCLTVLRDTKDIEKCTPISVARTMIKGAYLDLDFFRRECYAIPYGTELQFQTDYKGEIKACKAFCARPILDIYAMLVREDDKFSMNIVDGKKIVEFEPKPFNDGKFLGAFAVVLFADGGVNAEMMSIKEIEDVRQKFSKAPNSPAWIKSFGEMCKKVVLRRLTKMISLTFPTLNAQEAYEEGADSTIDPNRRVIDVEIEDPFKEVDAKDAEYQKAFNEMSAKYPADEDWQIEARLKEVKESK